MTDQEYKLLENPSLKRLLNIQLYYIKHIDYLIEKGDIDQVKSLLSIFYPLFAHHSGSSWKLVDYFSSCTKSTVYARENKVSIDIVSNLVGLDKLKAGIESKECAEILERLNKCLGSYGHLGLHNFAKTQADLIKGDQYLEEFNKIKKETQKNYPNFFKAFSLRLSDEKNISIELHKIADYLNYLPVKEWRYEVNPSGSDKGNLYKIISFYISLFHRLYTKLASKKLSESRFKYLYFPSQEVIRYLKMLFNTPDYYFNETEVHGLIEMLASLSISVIDTLGEHKTFFQVSEAIQGLLYANLSSERSYPDESWCVESGMSAAVRPLFEVIKRQKQTTVYLAGGNYYEFFYIFDNLFKHKPDAFIKGSGGAAYCFTLQNTLEITSVEEYAPNKSEVIADVLVLPTVYSVPFFEYADTESPDYKTRPDYFDLIKYNLAKRAEENNPKPLVVILDSTYEGVHSQYLQRFLSDFSSEIKDGRLVLASARSGNKLLSLGLDKNFMGLLCVWDRANYIAMDLKRAIEASSLPSQFNIQWFCWLGKNFPTAFLEYERRVRAQVALINKSTPDLFAESCEIINPPGNCNIYVLDDPREHTLGCFEKDSISTSSINFRPSFYPRESLRVVSPFYGFAGSASDISTDFNVGFLTDFKLQSALNRRVTPGVSGVGVYDELVHCFEMERFCPGKLDTKYIMRPYVGYKGSEVASFNLTPFDYHILDTLDEPDALYDFFDKDKGNAPCRSFSFITAFHLVSLFQGDVQGRYEPIT